jgi:hypothetical protein
MFAECLFAECLFAEYSPITHIYLFSYWFRTMVSYNSQPLNPATMLGMINIPNKEAFSHIWVLIPETVRNRVANKVYTNTATHPPIIPFDILVAVIESMDGRYTAPNIPVRMAVMLYRR